MINPVKSNFGESPIVQVGCCAPMAAEAGCCTPSESTAKAQAHEAAVDRLFDTRIDTWATGVVIMLDAMGTSFTVSGHKMPYATVHAGMVNDTANRTVGLTPTECLEKEAEVRLSWQEKLTQASSEECPVDIEITCRVPAEGKLWVVTEESLPSLDFVHHERGMVALPDETAGPLMGSPQSPRRNDQEAAVSAENDPEKSTEAMQSEALGAFSRLSIGQPVYIGYASGVFNNEAHSVIKRLGLHPCQPGSRAVGL